MGITRASGNTPLDDVYKEGTKLAAFIVLDGVFSDTTLLWSHTDVLASMYAG